MKKLVFLIALSILTAINAAVIVQDGKPQAEIILGDNPVPVAKFAAKELNTHIKLISGTELPIVKKRGTAKTAIYVGFVPGKKIDFKEQEYFIASPIYPRQARRRALSETGITEKRQAVWSARVFSSGQRSTPQEYFVYFKESKRQSRRKRTADNRHEFLRRCLT